MKKVVRYFEHCEKYGFKNKASPKILQKREHKAPDYDQILLCDDRGNTFPIYTTKFESKI